MIHFEILGESQEGREIAVITMTKGKAGLLPAFYFNGTHHGDEWSTTEAVLGLIDYLIRERKNPAVDTILKRYELFLQPLVNPDGHANSLRENASGIDLNRDYAFPKRPEDQSFRSVEAKLVKKLQDLKKFKMSVALHSGTECILWPYGFDWVKTPDNDLMYSLAKKSAAAMSMSQFFMSVELYPAEGEYSDYAYMKHRTFSFTYEISNAKTPDNSALASVTKRTIAGLATLMEATMAVDQGYFTVEALPADRLAKWGQYTDVWGGGARTE